METFYYVIRKEGFNQEILGIEPASAYAEGAAKGEEYEQIFDDYCHSPDHFDIHVVYKDKLTRRMKEIIKNDYLQT